MKKKSGRKMLKPDKTIFEAIYYKDGVTAEELAKCYKVKTQTIYNWAHQYRNQKHL